MENLYNQKVINANNVFDDTYLDAKMLYLYYFNHLPSMNFVNQIDGEKAFAAFKEKFAEKIIQIHQYKWFRSKKKKYKGYSVLREIWLCVS